MPGQLASQKAECSAGDLNARKFVASQIGGAPSQRGFDSKMAFAILLRL